jgi:hypothetical protein|tara:strand:+ start:147 stop:401 length:255 start_codon:yes stop_codon:yes gene_type:complete
MYVSAITPNNTSDKIEVQQATYYGRRQDFDKSVIVRINEHKSRKWDTLEDAMAHQKRSCQITLDRISIDTLISSLIAIRDNQNE